MLADQATSPKLAALIKLALSAGRNHWIAQAGGGDADKICMGHGSALRTDIPAPVEADRLAVLHASGLLDTPPEPDFDELVELAAQIMGTPFGALNLIDERRTWAKATVGLPHGTEVPRHQAFCAEAICSRQDTMVICDTLENERFADNLMTNRGVRFHVSVPLQVADGQAIGTLCVSDLHPRPEPDATQVRGLRSLAGAIGNLLEMRRQMARADALTLELEHLAHRDALTGLHNRRAFDKALEHHMQAALRRDRTLAVALIDLDHFKRFNDAHGHNAGGQMLRECARAWQRAVRSTAILDRYGGEEFGVVLPDCSQEAAVQMLDRIRALTPGSQTCSVGVALYAGHGSGIDLVNLADQALYAAKAAGRDLTRVAELTPNSQ